MATAKLGVETDAESTSADPAQPSRLSKDVIFEVLKNRRRRDVLEYLQSEGGTVTLAELAEQIAAWENDIEVAELNSTQRKRVYVALYQTHLPKMDDAGIVEYDRDRGNVTLSENADLLRMYLSDDFATDDPWYQRYVALSLLGGVLLFLSQFGAQAGFISGATLTVGLVSLFLVVSLAHMRNRRRSRRNLEAMLDRIE